MYDYDRQQFNSERTFVERTQEFTAPAYESSEEEASPLMLRYQEAITTKDTYHETKSKFAWIGEIEDERLLSALENLSDSDLELITLYAYEGYDTVEISKAFGTTKQNISKKIQRITNFIKNFQIGVVWRAFSSATKWEVFFKSRDSVSKITIQLQFSLRCYETGVPNAYQV